MAAPITHIILTSKLHEKYFPEKDIKPFLVGTSFPDIRYLRVIDRDKTHFPEISLDDVTEESDPFMAGMKFHMLVDTVRERFMVDRGIYDICPKSKFASQAIKIAEDEILYGKVENWQEIIDHFKVVYEQELNFDISEEDLIRWHKILSSYFSEKPNDDSVTEFILAAGLGSDVAEEIQELTRVLRSNEEFKNIVLEFYDSIDNEIRI